jgi:hypothetical protein
LFHWPQSEAEGAAWRQVPSNKFQVPSESGAVRDHM